MSDMLVNLYGPTPPSHSQELADQGFQIKRSLGADRHKVLAFINKTFPDSAAAWCSEASVSLGQQPSTCYIATYKNHIVGFCCYDATAKGMLGPLGVSEECRGKGVAKEMIQQTLIAMKNAGYAYAAIGWVSSEAFYQKVCNATLIPNSTPGIYQRLTDQ